MLEMRAAPGCFICIVGGCLADAGTALPILALSWPILGLCWAPCRAYVGPSLCWRQHRDKLGQQIPKMSQGSAKMGQRRVNTGPT